MTILHISDLHGNTGFIDKHAEEFRHADVVVLSGDITNFAGKSKTQGIVQSIIPHNKNIIGIAGNCDRCGVEAYLADTDISVHCNCRQISDITFCGMGGSLPPGSRFSTRTVASPQSSSAGLSESWHSSVITKRMLFIGRTFAGASVCRGGFRPWIPPPEPTWREAWPAAAGS